VAGADLAHVGRRFGDEVEADEALRAAVEARDREDLAHVSRLDAGGWYASVLRDDNARRVCGLNCVYAAARAMSGRAAAAELLHYDAAPDPAGGWVSFASLVAV
jgi:predicted class III extradiol MEMO1 family dioxygenase